MTGTRTASGGNVTYSFSWTGTTAKLDAIAEAAVKNIYKLPAYAGEPAYETLTIAQKIGILDKWISDSITYQAGASKIADDIGAAQASAQAYVAANYGL